MALNVSSRKRAATTLLLLLLCLFAYNALFSFSYSIGPNYRNVSVDTRVNITNAAPTILSVTLPSTVTLNAGGIRPVQCNVSIMDYNGYGDINITNATLYHSTSSPESPNSNNTHYSVQNCTMTGQNGNYRNVTCTFNVTYYALDGTWTCNATTIDNYDFSDTALNTTTIYELLALNVSTTLIDYGNLAVGDYSANKSVQITNIGNVPINFSVKGYGATPGDNLAFVCAVGNIAISNEKYSFNVSHGYATKTALTSSFTNTSSTIQKQTAPGALQTNTTYWQLYVPPNPYGVCNGTVVFQAESSTT